MCIPALWHGIRFTCLCCVWSLNSHFFLWRTTTNKGLIRQYYWNRHIHKITTPTATETEKLQQNSYTCACCHCWHSIHVAARQCHLGPVSQKPQKKFRKIAHWTISLNMFWRSPVTTKQWAISKLLFVSVSKCILVLCYWEGNEFDLHKNMYM